MQAQDRPQPKPGPAPKINIGKPQSFELKNGLKVMVVENHKLPRVSFSLTLDNAPYAEGSKKGVSDLTSSLLGNGTKTISKDAYNEEVDFLGASISISSGGAYASGLSKYSKRIFELMVDGALNPVYSQVEFDKEKTKLIEGLKSQEKSVTATARRIENALAFGVNHPNGEFVSESTINNITLEDVISNHKTYFVPENAYLVIVGDVTFKDVKKQITALFGKWEKASAPNVTYETPKDVAKTQINFVDMPNAVQSEIAVVNLSQLKMTDKDYFAALVANQILGGDFNSYLNMNLREAHGWTYGARSVLRGNKTINNFSASTQVRNNVTDSSVVEILKEIKRIRTEKVSGEVLKNVKAGYIGNFVMQIEKPSTIARYALQTKTQSLPLDFYENYIKNISDVTAEDVLNAANKYFLEENLRIIVVGKGADVIEGLEKLNITMNYFDKYGTKISKPVTKTVDPNLTAKAIVSKYIDAIGGAKIIATLKTISYKGTTAIPGAPGPITYIQKSSTNGKLLAEMLMGPMSVMKQVINGNTGYMVQQGQKMELKGEMLEEMKASAHPIPEMALLTKEGLTIKGIEMIDGSDAYAILNGKTTIYFDVKYGLKVSESTPTPNGNSVTNYKDYKEVKGIKVPHTLIMNIGIELNIKIDEVKINEGVTDADFN